jgi:hypothetical protein
MKKRKAVMATIKSMEKWNDTGFDLIKGSQYSYIAIGCWRDWIIKCNANGYSFFLLDLISSLKRTPSAKWFQLIGVVKEDISYTIELGSKGTFISPGNGRLWAYANDANFAYHNNSGSIKLEVEKISSLIKCKGRTHELK